MRVQKSRPATTRWRQCEVLIIDEVSMVDGAFFDKLEYVARWIRHNTRPFGGIQLVVCGTVGSALVMLNVMVRFARGVERRARTTMWHRRFLSAATCRTGTKRWCNLLLRSQVRGTGVQVACAVLPRPAGSAVWRDGVGL